MKNRTVAILLAFFLGWCGIHKFYTHRVWHGIFYFLFAESGIPLFLAIVDMVRYIFMDDDEFDKRYFLT